MGLVVQNDTDTQIITDSPNDVLEEIEFLCKGDTETFDEVVRQHEV